MLVGFLEGAKKNKVEKKNKSPYIKREIVISNHLITTLTFYSTPLFYVLPPIIGIEFSYNVRLGLDPPPSTL